MATADGSHPPNFLIAKLYFRSMESFQAGIGSPEGRATAADVPNLEMDDVGQPGLRLLAWIRLPGRSFTGPASSRLHPSGPPGT